MFKIAWRSQPTSRRLVPNTIWGISQYSTQEAAEKQIIKFSQSFPQNRYYVIPPTK